jgi:hypothetical protein
MEKWHTSGGGGADLSGVVDFRVERNQHFKDRYSATGQVSNTLFMYVKFTWEGPYLAVPHVNPRTFPGTEPFGNKQRVGCVNNSPVGCRGVWS